MFVSTIAPCDFSLFQPFLIFIILEVGSMNFFFVFEESIFPTCFSHFSLAKAQNIAPLLFTKSIRNPFFQPLAYTDSSRISKNICSQGVLEHATDSRYALVRRCSALRHYKKSIFTTIYFSKDKTEKFFNRLDCTKNKVSDTTNIFSDGKRPD